MESTERRPWTWVHLAVVAALLYVLWLLSSALTPIFVAFGLAYAFGPLVTALERRRVPRTVTTLSLLVVLFALIAILFATIVPALAREIQDFASGFPEFFSAAVERVAKLASGVGVRLPVNENEMIGWLRAHASAASVATLSPVVSYGKRVLSGAGAIVGASINVLVIPVFFFFFLRDLPKARQWIYTVIPLRARPQARELVNRLDLVLSGYIRGQVLVAAILGVVFAVALTLMGIKFGLVIGFIAGVLNLVPYLGQIAGFILSMTMALVDFEGTWKLVAIPALFLVTNFLEGNFISPKVVGERVGIAPVWAIIAVILATQLMGFWGLVIGVPAAGCLKVVLDDLLERYRRSEFFKK